MSSRLSAAAPPPGRWGDWLHSAWKGFRHTTQSLAQWVGAIQAAPRRRPDTGLASPAWRRGTSAPSAHHRGAYPAHCGAPTERSSVLPRASRRSASGASLAGTPPERRPEPGRDGSARWPGSAPAAGRGEVPRRRSGGLGQHCVSVEPTSIDSALAKRYDVGGSSRIVRTERLPSPPARVVGDPGGYRPGTIRDTRGEPPALPSLFVYVADRRRGRPALSPGT